MTEQELISWQQGAITALTQVVLRTLSTRDRETVRGFLEESIQLESRLAKEIVQGVHVDSFLSGAFSTLDAVTSGDDIFLVDPLQE